jgi:DNA-binding CsgD family transcriptional regulator
MIAQTETGILSKQFGGDGHDTCSVVAVFTVPVTRWHGETHGCGAKAVRCLAQGNESTMIWGEGMLDAFERVGWAALLISADGCVIGLNGEARRHVGREIALIQGQITATHRTANAALQRVIAGVLSADDGSALGTRGGILLPRASARPLMAYVIPVAEPSAQRTKALVVLVDSDKQREPTESLLREAFDLTPAQTRIAIGFARGRDLQEIANDQGISIGTVRKYFKAVLAKTNTSRQAELAILLARLAQRPQKQPAVPIALDRHTRLASRAE